MRLPASTLVAAFLACAGPLAAHQGHEHSAPAPYPEADAHRPTPLPDRVVLTWSGDPATTQAVTWRTSAVVHHALAQLTPATDRPLEASAALEIRARTEPLQSDLGLAHYHSVEFTDLAPGTRYAYRVGDGVNWSEWHHFRTARAEPAPFTFVYFGDAQNDIRTHWSRLFREAVLEAPRAAFTLHAGDLVNRAQRDAEWGEWFGAPAWVHATIPVVPTPGNHEYYNRDAGPETERHWTAADGSTLAINLGRDGARLLARAPDGRSATATLDPSGAIASVDPDFTTLTGHPASALVGRAPSVAPLLDRPARPGVRTLSGHWRPQFTLPRHGPAGLEETVYYFDYQGVRFIALDSNVRHEDQVPWLRAALTGNPMRWTVLTFHHPVFSPARNRDNPVLRSAWKPLLDEFKVDLVLTGHDHTYARSGDVAALAPRVGTVNAPSGYNQVYDPAIGTVFVVSVSGPKMYDLTNTTWSVRSAEDTQLFQIITIEGDRLRYEARTATNRLYDAFTLKKRPGQANQLLESLPPEIRRAPAP
jgi:3',5'-cyclic AMP phosphodiesterase CpdA